MCWQFALCILNHCARARLFVQREQNASERQTRCLGVSTDIDGRDLCFCALYCLFICVLLSGGHSILYTLQRSYGALSWEGTCSLFLNLPALSSFFSISRCGTTRLNLVASRKSIHKRNASMLAAVAHTPIVIVLGTKSRTYHHQQRFERVDVLHISLRTNQFSSPISTHLRAIAASHVASTISGSSPFSRRISQPSADFSPANETVVKVA